VNKQDLMVWTWCGWEPLQYYRRVGGYHEEQEGNAEWAGEWRELLDSERCAKALAEAGITWVTTHFFKGMGLEIESEEIAATAEMIKNYHQHGLKVFTYIQYGTIVPETLCGESEYSENWKRLDWNGNHDGHPYEYGDQYWRSKPCGNQPGFREYLLKCVEKAIDIGTDGIWIDNLQADGCHCPACQEAFREYLKKNIADPWDALGVKDLSVLSIPRAERPKDRLYQEWIRFRTEESRKSLDMMAEHARKLKPDVVMSVNIGLGTYQRYLSDNGNWVGNLGSMDFTYAENSGICLPEIVDGNIHSQHFPMKSMNEVGVKVVPGASAPHTLNGPYRIPAGPSESLLRRVFAESAMFGAHATNGPWGLRGENGMNLPVYLRDAGLRKLSNELAVFYRDKYEKYFAVSSDNSPVALFYDFEALGFDYDASLKVMEAFAQNLLQNQIPFRYCLSDKLESLKDVKILILPHVLPLSDVVVERLKAFVKDGGKIIATGRSSLYDENMRMRKNYGLADVFGVDFSNDFEYQNQHSLIMNPDNDCVLIPGEWGLEDKEQKPFCDIAGERIIQLIRSILGLKTLPEIISPSPYVVFDQRKLNDGKLILSLLNYSEAAAKGVQIRIPEDMKLEKVFSSTGNVQVKVKKEDSCMRLLLPELKSDLYLVVG
jgi:hypothetical protein